VSEDVPAPDGAPDYEELLLRAGFNFHVFLAGAMGFAAAHGSSADEYVAWMAERLGDTWSGLRGHGADAVLRLVLDNLASTGYAVEDVHWDAEESHAMVRAIPLGLEREEWQRIVAPFGVSVDDMHALFRVFVPLVRGAGATLDLLGIRDDLRITVRLDVHSESQVASSE
jgi:hypothetical protein